MEVIFMLSESSRFGKGMLILTLLMLGFSHKGTYGKVPVHFSRQLSSIKKALTSQLSDCQDHFRNHTYSLFINSNSSASLVLLVSYDRGLASIVQELLGTKHVPLLLSVSTLPQETAYFDLALLEFEQDGRKWRPTCDQDSCDIVLLDERHEFGGSLHGNEIRKAVILLAHSFDITLPIKIRYGDRERVMHLD